jgi:tetrahydromethanopterin S-methyltransferase subunit D
MLGNGPNNRGQAGFVAALFAMTAYHINMPSWWSGGHHEPRTRPDHKNGSAKQAVIATNVAEVLSMLRRRSEIDANYNHDSQ